MSVMKKNRLMLLVVFSMMGALVGCSKGNIELIEDSPEDVLPKNVLLIEEVQGMELEEQLPCTISMGNSEQEAKNNEVPIRLVGNSERKISFSFTSSNMHIKCVEPAEESSTMMMKYPGAFRVKYENESETFSLNLPSELEEEEETVYVYRIEFYFDKYKYIAFHVIQ